MEKKKLFSIRENEETALSMLKGTKIKQPKEEIKGLFHEEVGGNNEKEKLQDATEPLVPKQKSNRGRKRKYQEGEVIKLTALIDTHLSHTLKVTAKGKGTTVKAIMTRYLEEWIAEDSILENPYVSTKTKNYTGFSVTPDLRKKFADTCSEREKTQSYVMEALYQKAILDLK